MSLRSEIWEIVDRSPRPLVASAIFAKLPAGRCTLHVFNVTISQMAAADLLEKHPAPEGSGSGVEFAYGPGSVAPKRKRGFEAKPPKVKGFMALAREREMRERGRG